MLAFFGRGQSVLAAITSGPTHSGVEGGFVRANRPCCTTPASTPAGAFELTSACRSGSLCNARLLQLSAVLITRPFGRNPRLAVGAAGPFLIQEALFSGLYLRRKQIGTTFGIGPFDLGVVTHACFARTATASLKPSRAHPPTTRSGRVPPVMTMSRSALGGGLSGSASPGFRRCLPRDCGLLCHICNDGTNDARHSKIGRNGGRRSGGPTRCARPHAVMEGG
jgi:hypothetical protein